MEATIRDICTFVGGAQPDKKYFTYEKKDGYVRLVQIRDRLNDNWATYIPKDLARKTCEKHDILIGRYGPPIFQVFRGFEGAYNVALLKAIPKENINNDWLYYFLQQPILVDYINRNSKRTAGQWGVDLEMLYDYKINLPSYQKQKEVADILLEIDKQISRNNDMCHKLRLNDTTISCFSTKGEIRYAS